MMIGEFGADPDVQLVDPRHVQPLVREASMSDAPRGPFGRPEIAIAPETLVRRLRDLGIQADVVVFTHLAPRTVAGIELHGEVTSVFTFQSHRICQVGNDSATVKAYLADIKSHIRTRLRSQLPSLAAVSELQARYAAGTPAPAAIRPFGE